MHEVEGVVSLLWWAVPVTLLVAAACFVTGLRHAWWAYWLWRTRDVPIKNLRLAKLLEGITPPPYKLYAVLWFAAGVLLVVTAFMLRP